MYWHKVRCQSQERRAAIAATASTAVCSGRSKSDDAVVDSRKFYKIANVKASAEGIPSGALILGLIIPRL